jgi:4a-hydroxytetrahydrobiopterin dehydratase
MSTLDESTIREELASLDGWELEGDTIRRELRFDGFREAIDFIVRVADEADAADHHPELTNVYSRVTVALTTHDAGGVTQKDLDLARRIDAVAAVS